MQTQERPAAASSSPLKTAIAASQNYLLSLQRPDGHWVSELESNVTITAEAILLHKIWGTDTKRPIHKCEAYLRSHQRDHGGWELYFGDGGDLSTTVEAYMALRLLGVPASDPALEKARKFAIERGGIEKCRIFTKLHLALIGCYDWRGLPSLPPWVMFLSAPSPFTIYELSSWARSSTVPLLAVFDRKPVFDINPKISLDELYSRGIANAVFELPKSNDWSDIFVYLDGLFKFAESLSLVPFREEGIKAAERWTVERQEATGDWGGIIPAMLNSSLALRCLDYDVNDPVVQRGLTAIDNFALETEEHYWVQACVSPVWDTAIVLRALVDSGIAPDDPALVRGGQWLLDKQVLDYGDWAVKNREGEPGGWAFEYENRFYPDVDDSAMVSMTLHDLKLPDEAAKDAAIARAIDWIATMQCKPGGWAAFDIDNDRDWLNAIPYGDLKAMIDPHTADVTARVLEMAGLIAGGDRLPNLGKLNAQRLQRGLDYLVKEQEADGSWFGRWGVNYIYGTSGVLAALAELSPKTHRAHILRGAAWFVNCQNEDGGWGESCASYADPSLRGQGSSTASQTAWALIGLIAAGEATGQWEKEAIARGAEYLINTQNPDGSWDEAEFTGTGFPCHFYIRYHLYRQNFPLSALGRYQRCLSQIG